MKTRVSRVSCGDERTVEAGQAHRIGCSEIWGGIENTSADVCTNGIEASIYSRSCDGVAGGDIYYVTVCSHDLLTRILLADLRGHGIQVTRLSGWIYEILQENMNNLNGSSILSSLNLLLYRQGVEAITTAVVATFYAEDSKLYFCNAGHSPGLLRCRGSNRWEPLALTSTAEPSNLPLGVFGTTIYDEGSIDLQPGDRVALY